MRSILLQVAAVIVSVLTTLVAPAAGSAVAAGSAPTISGTARFGNTLTASAGSGWLGDVSYEWRIDGGSTVATTQTWAITPEAVGHTVTVTVNGNDLDGLPDTQTSTPTSTIAPATLTTAQPVITANPRVGAKAWATPGGWTSGTTFTYQWTVNGYPVGGATARYFIPRAGDLGKYISVYVRGSKPGYRTIGRSAARVGPVAKGYLVGSTPVISGTPRLGRTLTVAIGTWTSGVTFKFEWLMDGTVVKSGGGSLYLNNGAWRGKRVAFKVTASKAGYNTKVKVSASTSAITVPARTGQVAPYRCPSWAPIKGNADSGIYHMPGQRYYDATNPEDCFSSEAAAVYYGYRKAKV